MRQIVQQYVLLLAPLMVARQDDWMVTSAPAVLFGAQHCASVHASLI
jgi:hypothetical protein